MPDRKAHPDPDREALAEDRAADAVLHAMFDATAAAPQVLEMERLIEAAAAAGLALDFARTAAPLVPATEARLLAVAAAAVGQEPAPVAVSRPPPSSRWHAGRAARAILAVAAAAAVALAVSGRRTAEQEAPATTPSAPVHRVATAYAETETSADEAPWLDVDLFEDGEFVDLADEPDAVAQLVAEAAEEGDLDAVLGLALLHEDEADGAR